MDQNIVGVRYLEAGPLHYCSPGDLLLGIGDYVIVATDRGERLGWIVLTPDQVVSANLEGPVRVVNRLAAADEVERHRAQKKRAEEDVTRAQAAATRVDPRVRVASLAYDLSGAFAELTFTAHENSSSDIATRIEREVARALEIPDLLADQVGDRDRAKAVGGVGQCGRGLCCSTWMTEFPAISIKMAKDQGLAPNPSKISGVCGRLLCCLSFEVDAYREIVGTLPKVGKKLTTPAGKAKVLSINAMTEMVRLRFDETGQIIEISTDAVKRQMGTTLRPDELDAEFEEALREKDRRRTETLVAVLQPIDRPLRDASAADGPVVDEAERAERRTRRPRPAPSEGAPTTGGRGRSSGQPRGERRASGQRAADRPERTEQRSGIQITRRKATGDASVRGSEPRSERPRPAGDGSAGTGDAGDAEQKRRRRRGRRGGRGRGAAGDSPAQPEGE